MTSKSLIVLIAIVSCVCSPLRTTDAASLKSIGSISDVIRKDKEICPSSNIFLNSRYATICNNVEYPKVPMSLDDKNSKQFLCLGLYDRVYRLCWLATLNKVGKPLLPKNSTIFDLEVEKLATSKPDDFCHDWQNGCPIKYTKLQPFLNEFNKHMNLWTTCLRFCTDLDSVFDPLCSVLAVMDAISIGGAVGQEECLPKKKVEKFNENTKKGDVAVVLPSTVHEEAKKLDNESVKETVPKQTESNLSGAERNTAKKIQDPTSHVSSTKEEQQIETHNTAPQDAPSELNALPKPWTAGSAATLEKKDDKKKDESQTAGAIEDTKPKDPKENEKSVPSDPDLTNGDQIDTGDKPISEDEASDQETERMLDPPGVPKEEISEHTQDDHDEQTGGDVGPLDGFNELAPSTLVVPSEEVNESPPLPSDQQEFIPRLPGIRNDDDTHFFGYFSVIGIICIAGYVGYHNKQKILAMVLEGRRSRGSRGRRRPSTVNYRKLDCTLEEAVTSQCNSNVTHVIY